MEPKYRYSESTVRPQPVEVGKTTVYLRKDFAEVQRDDGRDGTYTIWTYQEAALSKDEALLVLAEQQEVHARELADADGINVDHEYRLTLLELGLADLDI